VRLRSVRLEWPRRPLRAGVQKPAENGAWRPPSCSASKPHPMAQRRCQGRAQQGRQRHATAGVSGACCGQGLRAMAQRRCQGTRVLSGRNDRNTIKRKSSDVATRGVSQKGVAWIFHILELPDAIPRTSGAISHVALRGNPALSGAARTELWGTLQRGCYWHVAAGARGHVRARVPGRCYSHGVRAIFQLGRRGDVTVTVSGPCYSGGVRAGLQQGRQGGVTARVSQPCYSGGVRAFLRRGCQGCVAATGLESHYSVSVRSDAVESAGGRFECRAF
jgi:hypothetical protein